MANPAQIHCSVKTAPTGFTVVRVQTIAMVGQA
jgi:hypothetical protein